MNDCDGTDVSTVKLTKVQALELAVETWKAREVVYLQKIKRLERDNKIMREALNYIVNDMRSWGIEDCRSWESKAVRALSEVSK